MPASSMTPEMILEAGQTLPPKVIKIDANIIAYFADYFHALRQGLSANPANSAHKARSNTAFVQNPS